MNRIFDTVPLVFQTSYRRDVTGYYHQVSNLFLSGVCPCCELCVSQVGDTLIGEDGLMVMTGEK